VNENQTLESEAASGSPDGSAVKTDEASTQGNKSNRNRDTSRADRLIMGGAWLVAISLVLLAGYLAWRTRTPYAVAKASDPSVEGTAGTVQTLFQDARNELTCLRSGGGGGIAASPAIGKHPVHLSPGHFSHSHPHPPAWRCDYIHRRG
jgi:hypothetical protein